LALAAALVVAALIAWSTERTPSPVAASAPAGVFSAERAMADVRVIGAAPHPIGSSANLAVRDHLLRRMTELGLQPQVHRDVSYADRINGRHLFIAGGVVENLVGVLPGRDRAAPALALMAHYDSVPGSPGAADDGAGVASVLETVRAIQARSVPARDVMVVITDGEESGLLGARAFFARDPMARRIGFLFNMEARGGGGRVQMFQTGQAGAGAIGLLRKTAVNPQASSLTGFIYQHMPNDTDFTVSRKAGVEGLNYAFIGLQFDYHAASSTPAALEEGTLQDMGQQVLATAAPIAFSPTLPKVGPTPVYSQLPGGVTLAYPAAVGWLVLVLAAALIAFAVSRARRIEAFPWTDIPRGAGAALFAVIGGCAVLHFARLATGADFGFLEQRFLLAQVGRWETALMLLGGGFVIFAAAELARGRRAIALVPLAAGVASCAFAGLDKLGLGLGLVAALLALAAYGRPVSRAGAWAGVLGLGLLIAIALQAYAPATAFVIAWPLVVAGLAAAASALSARRGLATLIAIAVLAALGLGWVGGFAHAAFLSLDMVEILGLPILLAAFLAWPLAQPDEGAPPARLVGPALLVAGLAVLVAVRFNHPYDARHPDVSVVGYQVDQETGRAWRFSATPKRPNWATSVLQTGGAKIAKLQHWAFRQPVDAAPAPFIVEAAPTITLAKQTDGTLLLHAVPPPGARILNLQLSPDTVAAITTLSGVPAHYRLNPGGWARIRWEAAPDGLDIVLRPGGPGKLTVRYLATLERWPATAPPLPPRPADVMPFETSDSTNVAGTRRFAW
jgi:hypothetical protein